MKAIAQLYHFHSLLSAWTHKESYSECKKRTFFGWDKNKMLALTKAVSSTRIQLWESQQTMMTLLGKIWTGIFLKNRPTPAASCPAIKQTGENDSKLWDRRRAESGFRILKNIFNEVIKFDTTKSQIAVLNLDSGRLTNDFESFFCPWYSFESHAISNDYCLYQ